MFKSLDYKDELDIIVREFVDQRYKGSKINDTTLGKMYYLKQFAKAAEQMYEQLRDKIDHGSPVDRKIVASDKFFSVQASTRVGAAKLDRELLLAEISRLIQATAAAAGAELSDIEARNQAATALERCTTYSKDSVVISVVENGNV